MNACIKSINYESDSVSDKTTDNSIGSKESTDNEIVLSAKETKFNPKEKLNFISVYKFFRKLSIVQIQKMIIIIEGTSTISLRLLDWFVTKHSRKYKTSYYLHNNKHNDLFDVINEEFSVNISYKAYLKSYTKHYFDPFRRKTKFFFNYDPNDKTKVIKTTIGQLNFFKWIFENNVLKYVEDNYEMLIKRMSKSNSDDKEKKKIKKKLTETTKKEPVIIRNKNVSFKLEDDIVVNFN